MDRSKRGKPPFGKPFARDDRGGPPGRKPFVRGEPGAGPGRPGGGAPDARRPFARDNRRGPPRGKPAAKADRRGAQDRGAWVRSESSGGGAPRPFQRQRWGGPEGRLEAGAGERERFGERDERRGSPERGPAVRKAWRGPEGWRPKVRGGERGAGGGGARGFGRGGPEGRPGAAGSPPGERRNFEAEPERRAPERKAGLPGGVKPPVHWRAAELGATRTGLARALSKLGYCSRKQAWDLINAGRVELNGVVVRDGEHPVVLEWDQVAVDGEPATKQKKVYLMLNKPRGLVTTASDEQGRPTVFECLGDFRVPHLSAVGRLDQASEGLLLFTNDHAWAAHLTSPERHVEKTYHVQVDRVVDEELAKKIQAGAESEGEHLAAKRVTVLRHGEKTSWLEIVLEEGRNRQIRRLVAAFGLEVLRLIRVAIGGLQLGTLVKGGVRRLTVPEIKELGPLPGGPVKRTAGMRPTERQLRRRF